MSSCSDVESNEAGTSQGHQQQEQQQCNESSRSRSLWAYLNTDVDVSEATGPLAAYCFMTGYIDSISFSAVFVWCGFQTGNFIQLSLALARLFEVGPSPLRLRDTSFHVADRQALCSLVSFFSGAFMGGRLGDFIGPCKRLWLFFGTFIQAVLTMAAAFAIWSGSQPGIADNRGDPSWTNTLTFVGLAFMSASIGLQGIQAKRLNSQFGTTLVLTTIWVELVSDPRLFKLRQRVASRDLRCFAALSLFAGAFVSRALLAKVGAAAALGIASGIRLLVAASWVCVGSGKMATMP